MINQHQRKRLTILREGHARVLKSGELKRFDMRYFVRDKYSNYFDRPSPKRFNKCGTSVCAAGRGPALGIKPRPEHYRKYSRSLDWEKYALWLAGKPLFCFLFEEYWPDSIQEFIARADYVLKHGSEPDGWDYDSRFAESAA